MGFPSHVGPSGALTQLLWFVCAILSLVFWAVKPGSSFAAIVGWKQGCVLWKLCFSLVNPLPLLAGEKLCGEVILPQYPSIAHFFIFTVKKLWHRQKNLFLSQFSAKKTFPLGQYLIMCHSHRTAWSDLSLQALWKCHPIWKLFFAEISMAKRQTTWFEWKPAEE